MKKIILTNLLVFISVLFVIYIFFSLINLILSGQPRYWEIVHNRNFENLKVEKEKIVQIKRETSNRVSYLSVLDKKYKNLNYSGKFKNAKCGSFENGYNELIYQTDKHGFRENIDFRYISSDFVLLGDSFAESICENKPNDLKSNLLEKTKFSYLNLGTYGTDYPDQALYLFEYAKETNFKGLVWIFYEGNDYEKKSYNISKIENNQIPPDEIKINYNYDLDVNHEISILFRIKVWLAEFIRGPSVLAKFFIKYDRLLDVDDYDKVLTQVKNFLDKKNVKKRYIIYVPSWQKISLYKLKKIGIYENHPQTKQLNQLKNNVKKIAMKNGFSFIDGDNFFFNNEDPLSVFHYKLNTHFNKFGYELLAESIYKNLH